MAGKSKPGAIHLRIVEVMKRFPDGISGGPVRQELGRRGFSKPLLLGFSPAFNLSQERLDLGFREGLAIGI
jgi:hypothetical protein